MARINEFQLWPPVSFDRPDLAKQFFELADWYPAPQLVSRDIRTNQYGETSVNWKTGEVTVKGAGTDIWAKDDSFHFGFQKLEGDGQIVARLLGIQKVDDWAKAGLMFRESLSGNSKHVFLALTPSGRATLQNRPESGADSTSITSEGFTTPLWLKLVRQGNKFTAYTSQDKTTWKEYRSVNVSMPREVHVGLAMTAHKQDTVCISRWEAVQISPLVPASSAPSNEGKAASTASLQ